MWHCQGIICVSNWCLSGCKRYLFSSGPSRLCRCFCLHNCLQGSIHQNHTVFISYWKAIQPSFHPGKCFLVIINSTRHWLLLLFPPVKFCWLLFSDGESKLRTFLCRSIFQAHVFSAKRNVVREEFGESNYAFVSVNVTFLLVAN